MDVADEGALRKVLTRCEAGFYLVHSLGAGDFVLMTDGWRRGSGGRRGGGIQRIVYLGGLGQGPRVGAFG